MAGNATLKKYKGKAWATYNSATIIKRWRFFCCETIIRPPLF
ncbi:hypothetical protein [Moraxella lacunata]